MTERRHYTIRLKLDNQFLKWVYSHKLQSGSDVLAVWKDKTEPIITAFGGLHGTQFKRLEDIRSFNQAFNKLLSKFDIDPKHNHMLMYFMIFFKSDYEAQSLSNNEYNRLIEYAQFIIKLYVNSEIHFARMKKDKSYQMIYDESTREYLFAKKELYNTMPLEELVEFMPDSKHADDVISYMRISICGDELYIPPGMAFSVNSPDILKDVFGSTIPHIKLPAYLQYDVFKYVVNKMVDAHKRANTLFYQYLNSSEVTPKDMQKVYNQYKKHQVSQSQSLLKVAIMISDYLKEQKLITVKRTAASFLFEYFSLFKAFPLKSNPTPPEEYQELPRFYIRNGINSETVRMMLKDVGEI